MGANSRGDTAVTREVLSFLTHADLASIEKLKGAEIPLVEHRRFFRSLWRTVNETQRQKYIEQRMYDSIYLLTKYGEDAPQERSTSNWEGWQAHPEAPAPRKVYFRRCRATFTIQPN